MKLTELNDILHSHKLPPDIIKVLNKYIVDYKERKALCEKVRERKEELEHLVNHNPDTNLPIRRIFERDVERLLEGGHGDEPFVVFIVRLNEDYNKIKNSRDRNKVLLYKTVLRILEVTGAALYQSDRIDEFLLILRDVHDSLNAAAVASKLHGVISAPHEPPADDVQFSCHIGVSIFPDHGDTREKIMSCADIAQAECEYQGRAFLLYSNEIGEQHSEKIRLEEQLKKAIKDGFEEFSVVFQPIVGNDYKIKGSEALIRWNSPVLGNVSPAKFIPIAEKTGDITTIGQWVLYRACKHLKECHEMGFPDLYVSVNLSPQQFKLRDIVKRIKGVLKALNLSGEKLKLEITEGVLMENPQEAIEKMQAIRNAGIRLSIDDFGTGYSSLGYLKNFPFDTLKIDRSFIIDVAHAKSDQGIVKAVISIADSMQVDTLAEGVENAEQLDFLFRQGCKNIQGYYFSKPLPVDEFKKFIQKGVDADKRV